MLLCDEAKGTDLAGSAVRIDVAHNHHASATRSRGSVTISVGSGESDTVGPM